MSTHIQIASPDGLAAPLGAYSHVSSAVGNRVVFVAGQVGIYANGTLAGPGMREQAIQTFENLKTALESQGLSMSEIVKLTSYMTSSDDIGAFYGAREEVFPSLFPSGEYPPNTLLVVDRLVKPEFVVEIEAIAIGEA